MFSVAYELMLYMFFYLNAFKSRKTEFFPVQVHVTFVEEKAALGQGFLRELLSSSVSSIPLIFISTLPLSQEQTG